MLFFKLFSMLNRSNSRSFLAFFFKGFDSRCLAWVSFVSDDGEGDLDFITGDERGLDLDL